MQDQIETTITVKPAAELLPGDTILFPVWDGPSVTDEPRTVAYVVEHPETRVLYFREGGYGIADRWARIETVTAEAVA